MTRPYYEDHSATIYAGKNLDVLPALPDESIDCVVTSPPYFGLRDYGVEGQYGAEETPTEFVANLIATFREVRRVLADDGTLWLNLGDSYAGSWGAQGKVVYARKATRTGAIREGMPPAKNLIGIPWRTAFALQDDGWILRNSIIWHKPNAMPHSVTDRFSGRYEHLFLFSKSRRYWFDLDAVREPHKTADRPLTERGYQPDAGKWAAGTGAGNRHRASGQEGVGRNPNGKNPGDVWSISTTPFVAAHFATFPPELPRRCIKAGCRPGGTVLDTFHGAGTTGMVARELGRKYVGIELNPDYIDLSLQTRMKAGPA